MPIYTFNCGEHGEQYVYRSMQQAADPYFCTVCEGVCKRVFDVPHFLEDRLRFTRNPRTGNDHSDMLGTAYPKDRKERDAIYAQKGIEPVTKADMPSQWKRALEYKQHLDAGGDAVDPKTLIDKPDLSGVKSIAQQLRESGKSLGV